MAESRTKNATRNVSMAMACKFVDQILNFVVRTVFIKTLSVEYLGVNGLFNNILSFLSLAELGIGSAIVYLMYKPIAEGNTKKIQVYMYAYKRLYMIMGIIVFAIGISLTPFLDFFIKERPSIDINLELVYVLYIVQTVSTYFFAYKQSIFTATQNGYVINLNTMIFSAIRSVFEIIFLVTTKNFIVYLLIRVITNYAQNICIAILANRKYPYLKEKQKDKLTEEESHTIRKNVSAMFLHKVGAVVLNSSDNLILSKFVGLVTVGLYSNYSTILTLVKTVLWTVFDAIVPSVGNLCTQNDDEQKYKVFKSIQLANLWISGFCTICLGVLINPFITLWIGEDYLLPQSVVWAVIVSYYVQTNMRAIEMFRSATGLFYKDRFVPLVQCAINVVVSIIMVRYWGVAGIFVGTSLSVVLTGFWVQPMMVFKYIFKKPLYLYFVSYLKNMIITVCALLLTIFATQALGSGLISFILRMICCVFVPNFVFILAYFRKPEFKYLWDRGVSVIKGRKSK